MSPLAASAGDTSSAKRRQILDGARQVFSELGYERASVDQIAARAGVSKATVYNHFQDKKALFIAAVVLDCDGFREGVERCLAGGTADVEQGLRSIGERVMTMSLSPPVAKLYRATIAEAERMPELGRLVFERGTLALQEAIASLLRRWNEVGALQIEDPRSAAVAFIALCQGDLVIRMRLGVLEHPVEPLIHQTVERAVSIFVRAHRP
jgi:AcrR family transcriptional regulator